MNRVEWASPSGEKRSYLSVGDFESSPIPVVFIHGAGGEGSLWKNQLEAIESMGYFGLAPDLSAHGQSERKSVEEISIETYAQEILELLDHIKAEKVVLVGHSMGGATAITFSLQYQNRVEGLILVDTGAKLRVAPMVFDALKADMKQFVDLLTQFGFVSTESDSVQSTIDAMKVVNPNVAINDFQACDNFDVMREVENIQIPTAIIVGEQDQLTPVKYAEFLRSSIPNSELTIIPESGHFVMVEQPSETNTTIISFLRNLSRKKE